jgi:hypothetical protein
MKGIYIGATGQNVGKTTLSLGLFHALRKHFDSVGFIKPIGQEHVRVGDKKVDKDVALFLDYFQLKEEPEKMSPVLFTKGTTEKILDGKIKTTDLKKKVLESFTSIYKKNSFTLVEGTGHIGVGSIAQLSCAKIAKLFQLDVILISDAGIGSTVDQILVQKALLDVFGVNILGVVINKVIEEKKEKIVHYLNKALRSFNIPILGVIPFSPYLSSPTFEDFEILFKTAMISGQQHRLRHFIDIAILTNEQNFASNQLGIIPATKENLLERYIQFRHTHKHLGENGVIITGKVPPSTSQINQLKAEQMPALFIDLPSFTVMKQIIPYVSQFLIEDTEKIEKAIELVQSHFNFDKVLQ